MFLVDFKKSLGKSFFLRDATDVAPELIGKVLVRKTEQGSWLAGRIVETEAYLGKNDDASHSAAGITKRNAPMFHSGGVLYVYIIYGIHHCANLVTGAENNGQAVLIRAVEPLLGLEQMKQNRKKEETLSLCRGPGNTAKAFGFDLSDNFLSLCSKKLFVQEDSEDCYSSKISIEKSQRIGIRKSEELKLRFFHNGSEYVSGRRKKSKNS